RLSDNLFGLQAQDYDPGKTLVIDPWVSYFGGTGRDDALGVATDAAGSAIFVGTTESPNSIATSGSFQSTYTGGSIGFIAKFSVSGTLLWSTYYNTLFNAVTTGLNGDIYAGGLTWGATNISTSGSHQSMSGGFVDGVLVKFNSAGVRLWGTFYGGTGADIIYSVRTDVIGNVYACGTTDSPNNIATPGAPKTTFTGIQNAFLAKFDASGVRQWGTYYGDAYDYAFGVATDNSGNAYVTGWTGSSNGISTPGAHQETIGLQEEAFLAKFSSSGILSWGTYYGGIGLDESWAVATDNFDNVLITGVTTSDTGIATPGSFQSTTGGYDIFVAKFNNAGQRLWGTYHGPGYYNWGYGIATDNANDIYIAGLSMSPSGISTAGTYQTTYGGGDAEGDAVVLKFTASGAKVWG
ncbi:MAG: hypothetical protein EOP49_43485, partial [Sphingobacteriales bacterium]